MSTQVETCDWIRCGRPAVRSPPDLPSNVFHAPTSRRYCKRHGQWIWEQARKDYRVEPLQKELFK